MRRQAGQPPVTSLTRLHLFSHLDRADASLVHPASSYQTLRNRLVTKLEMAPNNQRRPLATQLQVAPSSEGKTAVLSTSIHAALLHVLMIPSIAGKMLKIALKMFT